MTRYARQMILPEIGADGQARLSTARLLVVGAGGLAAPALPLLAGAGIGHLTIVDPDQVDISNLHRQTLFSEADCLQSKAQIAARRMRELNSEVTVVALPHRLTPANAGDLVGNTDLVLDCADSFAASYTLSDTCRDAGIPLISASALGLSGYVGGFCAGAPSLRAVFPDAPDSGASCASAGVMGPVVSAIGAIQAQMALAVLLGITPSPLGQMVQMDGRTFRTNSFRFDGAPEPENVLTFACPTELTREDMIVDLRPVKEVKIPAHPNALRISAGRLGNRLPDPSRRLALCCTTGLRAWRAAEQVQQTWPGEIVLVAATTS